MPILLASALAGGPCGGGFLEGEAAGGFAESLVGGDDVELFDLGVLRVSGALDLSRSDFLWIASNAGGAEIQRLRQ